MKLLILGVEVDESTLRKLIVDLETLRSSSHWWLELFTWFVVVGVALEVIFVIWEYRDEFHDYKRGIVHAPEKPKTILFALGFLGTLLVAVGVAGELKEGAKIDSIETRIRNTDNSLFLLLSKEAGDAASSAVIAHQEASSVKQIADEARADAKDALGKAQTAQTELAHSEFDAAKAQNLASNALKTSTEAQQISRETKLEVTKTAEQMKRVRTPRSISHPEKLIIALSQFSNTEYVFSGVGSNDEAIALLQQFDDILHKAGWKRIPARGAFPAINVFGQDSKNEDAVTVAIVSGIVVSIDSQEDAANLQTKTINNLPAHIRAAISLNLNITSNLYPPQEPSRPVDVQKGQSTTVRISIGSKP